MPESVYTFEEDEPNNSGEEANNVGFLFPEQTFEKLHIQGAVNSDIFGDPFDYFYFRATSAGTYRFSLSELISSDLNLAVMRDEAFISLVVGVNYFPSPIDAPGEGPIESVILELSEGVTYYVEVAALETNALPHNYTVIVEKL